MSHISSQHTDKFDHIDRMCFMAILAIQQQVNQTRKDLGITPRDYSEDNEHFLVKRLEP